MRQYEQGKCFCDAVAAEAGIAGAEPRLGLARGAAQPSPSWTARLDWLARTAARPRPPPPEACGGRPPV